MIRLLPHAVLMAALSAGVTGPANAAATERDAVEACTARVKWLRITETAAD
jgi:hypothetical protein